MGNMLSPALRTAHRRYARQGGVCCVVNQKVNNYPQYQETDGIEAHLLLALGELLATTAPMHAACHRRKLPP